MTPSELFKLADAAGQKAASEVKMATYGIHSVDIFGNKIPNSPVYTMVGSCGFAWVNIKPATSKFGRWLKDNGLARKDSYYGGLCYWIGAYGQCYEQKEAYAYAFARVLQENGIAKAYAGSRLD